MGDVVILMSGLEALGAIASAAHVAAYAVKIATCLPDIYNETKTAFRRILKHSNRIQELIQTITLIKQYKSLQLDDIHVHIKATLSKAQSLHDILYKVS